MAAEDASKVDKKGRKPAQKGHIVTDPRFEAVQWDPRFQRFPKAKRHVEIDRRFEGMFSKPEFQQHSTVDKRGRKVAKRKNHENMRKYYKLKDEDAWREDAANPSEVPVNSEQANVDAVSSKPNKIKAKDQVAAAEVKGKDPVFEEPASIAARLQGDAAASSQDEEEDNAQDIVDQRWARARGLLGDSSSESEEEAADAAAAVDIEGDEEEDLEQEWGIGAMAANPDENIPDSDETPRLAIVDLDWDKIRAVDILAVLRSFLGKAHSLKGVTVYPSDFGLQKMQEEAAVGPQGIFGKKHANGSANGQSAVPAVDATALSDSSSDDEDSGSSQDEAAADAMFEAAALADDDDDDVSLDSEEAELDNGADDAVPSSDESGDEVDQRRLQLYERSRLRYYYAVVDCQDVRTAAHLYAECDGIEFLRSACKLDMRFVPDDQSFETRQVRDAANEVPVDYTPPDFTTAALQHTNVKLTWDADDDTRKKALRKKMTEDDIKDDDFKAYLASSSSEDEPEAAPDAAALRERYRSLLLSNSGGAEARTGGGKGGAWGAAAASDSDQDSEEADGADDAPEKADRRAKKGDMNMDMEVTFTPGLEGLGARLLAQRKEASQRKGDTVWEAYLRRQKEKKAAAKAQGRRHASSDEDESEEEGASQGEEGDQDPFFQQEDNPFDDPFFKDSEEGQQAPEAAAKPAKAKKASAKAAGQAGAGTAAGKAAEKAAEQQRQAQLELLMMDDSALQDVAKIGGKLVPATVGEEEPAGRKGKQKVSRKERLQRKRDQKRAERQAGSDDEDLEQGKSFQPNLQDARFKSLFTSADFALDPTDPRFKQTDGSNSIAKAVATQRQQQAPIQPAHAATTAPGQRTHQQQPAAAQLVSKPGVLPHGNDSAQIKAMVASLKRKSSKAGKAGNSSKAGVAAINGQEPGKKAKKQRVSQKGA